MTESFAGTSSAHGNGCHHGHIMAHGFGEPKFVFPLGAACVVLETGGCHIHALLKDSETVGKEFTNQFYTLYTDFLILFSLRSTTGYKLRSLWLQDFVRANQIADPRSSILDPRSSILDPRSSILDPRSSISSAWPGAGFRRSKKSRRAGKPLYKLGSVAIFRAPATSVAMDFYHLTS